MHSQVTGMTNKSGTKDDAERLEEEAERLVTPSPKNKPPRRDRQRNRIRNEDTDTTKKDKDLSLNFKDIGGSSHLATHVARVFLGIDFNTEEALEKYMEEHKGADPKKHRVLEEEGSESDQDELPKDKKPRKKEKAPATKPRSKALDPEARKERQKKEEVKQLKAVPEDQLTPDQKKERISLRVEELRKEGLSSQALMQKIYDAETSIEGKAAERLLLEQKDTFPKGMGEPPESFKSALPAKSISRLEEQASRWDVYDYEDALSNVAQKLNQAKFDGDEKAARYYDQVMSVYQNSGGNLRTKSLADTEVTSLIPSLSDLQGMSSSEVERRFNLDAPSVYQAAMFSGRDHVTENLKKIEEVLATLTRDQEGDPEATQEIQNLLGIQTEETEEEGTVDPVPLKALAPIVQYYEEVRGVLGDVAQRKQPDPSLPIGQLITRIDASDSSAVRDLEPGKVDFTDRDQIASFVGKMRKLSDKELIDLVKDDPGYRLALDIDSDVDSLRVSLDPNRRERLFDNISRQLELTGYYEQLRLDPQGPGRARTFDPVQVKKWTERLEKERQRGAVVKHPKGLAEYMAFLFEDLMTKKQSNINFQAMAKRIASSVVKTAQYRGLPGYLPKEQQPPSPEWRLPIGNMALGYEDYLRILEEAKRWRTSTHLAYVAEMEGAQDEMLLRIALDYAIHTTDNYRYAGMIDAPTYDKLLAIFKKI